MVVVLVVATTAAALLVAAEVRVVILVLLVVVKVVVLEAPTAVVVDLMTNRLTDTIKMVVTAAFVSSGVLEETIQIQTLVRRNRRVLFTITHRTNVPVKISVTGGLHPPLFHAIIPRYSKEHNASIHTHLYR